MQINSGGEITNSLISQLPIAIECQTWHQVNNRVVLYANDLILIL